MAASYQYDALPDYRARRHPCQRLLEPLQRMSPGDDRSDLAVGDGSSERTHLFAGANRLVSHAVAPIDTDDRCDFEKREIPRERGDRTGRESDDEVPTTPRDGAERRLGLAPADRIDDYVGPFSRGMAIDCGAQIFGCVVDGGVRTIRAADGELPLRGRSSNTGTAPSSCD